MLGRERHDGGVAAISRGHGCAVPVVRAQHAHAGQLFDVAVAVDAAGHDQPAGGVDGALARRQFGRNRGDDAVHDADVADEIGIGRDNAAVVQGQVEVCHGLSGTRWVARFGAPCGLPG
ncbi:hypothetical protein D3C85_1524190 [compost metagenome]